MYYSVRMEQSGVVDAIIIGAGAAGLAAASELRANGRTVVVVEARSRVGGRILTYRDPDVAVPIELGAEFLHGATPNTDTIIQGAGLTAIDVVGDSWQARDGHFRKLKSWKKVKRVLRNLDEHRVPDRSLADYLSEHAGRKKKSRHARARALASEFVQGFHAADAALVSERWLARMNDSGGNPGDERSGRLLDGYDRVPAWLARDVFDAVELNTVVTNVDWERGKATVTCRDVDGFLRTFEGSTLIVTAPVGVLKAAAGEHGAIEFSPEVPGMVEAVNGLEMGSALRTVFAFSDRIWESGLPHAPRKDAGLTELSFLHSPRSTFPVWWTQFPVRAPVLVGWVGGPAALAMSSQPDTEIERLALNDLASHLGTTYECLAGLVRGSWMHNWDSDPFSRGAYSYPAVGGSGSARKLARPVEQTIFFAGEATDTDGRSGTVEGALASGSRAARGVLMALGVESLPNQ
ncbi:MAG: NAD(P)/FAD-dependent oxidoreductase [Gemmatimonadaceae bacterium]